MPKKGNINNLIPPRSADEAREKGKKGGLASGEARRKKKALREELETLLSLPLTNEKMKNSLKRMGVPVGEDSTMQTVVVAALVAQAASGDVKAFTAIRDTVDAPKAEDKEREISEHMQLMREAFEGDAGQEDDGDE